MLSLRSALSPVSHLYSIGDSRVSPQENQLTFAKPRVLFVHNAYLNRGGEDEVFEAEAGLLESRGHEVRRFRVEADSLSKPSLAALPGLAAQTVWSRRYYRVFRELVAGFRPDAVHFHNTFPLLSPSVYSASRAEGAAVVQTLHNYRLLCPQSTFFRDGRPCEDCKLLVVPWPGALHGCYHDSRLQSAVVATMLAAHNLRGTWHKDVDLYLTPSRFVRSKFLEGGLAGHKVVTKPNFLSGPVPAAADGPGRYFVYVGRLVDYKGIRTIIEAWERYLPDVPLRVLGDGPMTDDVARLASRHAFVSYLGRKSHDEVFEAMRDARAVLVPSEWYEPFGMTIIEAFAAGRPVIAADIGPLASELVSDNETGLVFAPGDARQLAERVRWAWEHPGEMAAMGSRARDEFMAKYSAERNYGLLLEAYAEAQRMASARRGTGAYAAAGPPTRTGP